uniref:Uncharacterized protein n=1 Tax=Arundo donax TaxID=35708 RepID=A0A0A9EQH5_ARUDO
MYHSICILCQGPLLRGSNQHSEYSKPLPKELYS